MLEPKRPTTRLAIRFIQKSMTSQNPRDRARRRHRIAAKLLKALCELPTAPGTMLLPQRNDLLLDRINRPRRTLLRTTRAIRQTLKQIDFIPGKIPLHPLVTRLAADLKTTTQQS